MFALALRLHRLPSELAERVTPEEFVELIAFAEIEREELDLLHKGPPPDPEAEAQKSWAALAGMVERPQPEPDPQPPA